MRRSDPLEDRPNKTANKGKLTATLSKRIPRRFVLMAAANHALRWPESGLF